MQALLITLGAFALILVLARLRVPLPVSILVGGVACGMGLGMSFPSVLASAAAAVLAPRTIALLIIVACLLALSGTMQAGGQMKRIVELAKLLLRRPVVTMAALPALIGMLPMPGGALFSAPMVASAAGGQTVPPGKLSAINYWFRHVWEYWWPLFPGVIVAVAVTDSSLASFFLLHFPLTIFSILAGLLILRKTHPELHATSPRPPTGTKRNLLKATSSIWLVLLGWLAVKVSIGVLLPVPNGEGMAEDGSSLIAEARTYLPILVGLAVSLIWTTKANGIGRARSFKIWTDPRILYMLLLVVSVMVFQHVLKDANAPGRISNELTDLHVPIIAVFAILPFVAGLVTGIAVGFVGTSFPILMGLLAGDGQVGNPQPYIALAYLFGHMGQMLSPLHLCHVVSNRYFKTGFGPVYKEFVPTAAATCGMGIVYIACLMVLMN